MTTTDPANATADASQVSAQIPDWGGADVFALVEQPVPAAAADEILIRTHAAGLNPVDSKVRAGMYSAAFTQPFPITLGRDFSGTVLAVGADAAGGWLPGDEVVGTLMFKPALGA